MLFRLTLLFIFVGCGTIKKTSEQTNIKDNTITEVDATKYTKSYTLEPVDLKQPILIGKDTIYNTRVIYNNTKEIVKEKQANNIELKEEKQSKQIDYSETIKIVSNRLIIALIVLIVLSALINKLRL